MHAEQPETVRYIENVSEGAVSVWVAALDAWSSAPKDERNEALSAALKVCADSNPDLLPDVFRLGIASYRPLVERRAFAGQLGLLAEHEPHRVRALYQAIIQGEPKPGMVTAALDGGVSALREHDPDSFALSIAETMLTFPKGSAEWKKARSLLFDGSHSGYAAYEVIEPALRSKEEDVRRMTARYLLPELVTKAQYGKEILDLIERRLDEHSDPMTVMHCVTQLPAVYDRRPGQARRIVSKAWQYPDSSGTEMVRDALIDSMRQAGMADKLPAT